MSSIDAIQCCISCLNCALNQQISFTEKAEKLKQNKILCEETLSKSTSSTKATRGIEHDVFVCNFAQLQFPQDENCVIN